MINTEFEAILKYCMHVYVCVCVCVCVHARSVMFDSLQPYGL